MRQRGRGRSRKDMGEKQIGRRRNRHEMGHRENLSPERVSLFSSLTFFPAFSFAGRDGVSHFFFPLFNLFPIFSRWSRKLFIFSPYFYSHFRFLVFGVSHFPLHNFFFHISSLTHIFSPIKSIPFTCFFREFHIYNKTQ